MLLENRLNNNNQTQFNSLDKTILIDDINNPTIDRESIASRYQQYAKMEQQQQFVNHLSYHKRQGSIRQVRHLAAEPIPKYSMIKLKVPGRRGHSVNTSIDDSNKLNMPSQSD